MSITEIATNDTNSNKNKNEVISLVLDSGSLIKGTPVRHLAEKFYTVPEVLAEIRDKKSRDYLAQLPFELISLTPSDQALKEVINFSKKSGDFSSLSVVDIKVLALTYMLEVEANGTTRIRKEPICASFLSLAKMIQPGVSQTQNHQNVHNKGLSSSADEKLTITEKKSDKLLPDKETLQKIPHIKQIDSDKDEEILQMDPDISNIKSDSFDVYNDNDEKRKNDEQEGFSLSNANNKPVIMKVACMTTDYTMQNVMLQMRLNLLSIDGIRIKRIKSWVLRCHACFKITSNMEKQFCPNCGGPTLIRTSTSTDENGNIKYYLKKNFQYNLRGTKYPIPNPKGGRKPNNLILREDQPEYQKAIKAHRKQKIVDIFDPDYVPKLLLGSSSNSKSFPSGPPVIGYGRRNPNETKRGKSKGKKKH
ncbi:581_t:CDS:2 [Ambispora leptoticha]|uniref:20S-pre-rRNA D-site endonuclease NOB1 n=1 Tax=Ambispora leptoticha TaxID=144679 RepID=A0A9N8YPJ6_9GLOM|nr:581_t:CDS:2 [Ambispora leptoticha]